MSFSEWHSKANLPYYYNLKEAYADCWKTAQAEIQVDLDKVKAEHRLECDRQTERWTDIVKGLGDQLTQATERITTLEKLLRTQIYNWRNQAIGQEVDSHIMQDKLRRGLTVTATATTGFRSELRKCADDLEALLAPTVPPAAPDVRDSTGQSKWDEAQAIETDYEDHEY